MKSFKGILALMMTGVMALSLASCSSSGVEPLDFAEKFNKESEGYQIDTSNFAEIQSDDGSKRRSYSFRSNDQNVGTFTFTAYVPSDSDQIDRITLFLPIDKIDWGALFGQDDGSESGTSISDVRKAAFKDLFIDIAQAYTGASESEATDYFAEMGLDDSATYTKKETTTKTYGDYTFTFSVTALTSSLQITNDKLYTGNALEEAASASDPA